MKIGAWLTNTTETSEINRETQATFFNSPFQQDVFGFNVSVDDSLIVDELDGGKELAHHVTRLFLAQSHHVVEVVKKFTCMYRILSLSFLFQLVICMSQMYTLARALTHIHTHINLYTVSNSKTTRFLSQTVIFYCHCKT